MLAECNDMDSGEQNSDEMRRYNIELKKAILDVMFRLSDTFYIHCMPDPSLFIGSRGLVGKEESEGIILVFGPYSTRNLTWDETAIHCEMQFRSNWERVTIPFQSIFRIFDKNGQVLMQWITFKGEMSAGTSRPSLVPDAAEEEKLMPEKDQKSTATPGKAEPTGSTVIEVDFASRKKSRKKKKETPPSDDDNQD